MDIHVGTDFIGEDIPDTPILFSFGSSVSCFNITIIDDSVFEDLESFSVSLSIDKDLSTTSSTVVIIEDNDGMMGPN